MVEYNPPTGFYFKVSFEQITTVPVDFRFQSVSGLSAEVVTETYKEGGENRFDHELVVKTQYPDLVLKRGLWVSDNKDDSIIARDVQEWCMQMMHRLMAQPTNIDITLLNAAKVPLKQWTVMRAWPKKWEVTDLSAASNEVLIETIQLHYDWFKMK